MAATAAPLPLADHPDYYRIPIEDRKALVEETRQKEQAETKMMQSKLLPQIAG